MPHAQLNPAHKLEPKFVMKKGLTLASLFCKLKQKMDKENRKDLDYIIKWETCDMKYVGGTGQQFRTKKQQHQRDVKNKIATEFTTTKSKTGNIKLPGMMQFT